jgi:putative transposase
MSNVAKHPPEAQNPLSRLGYMTAQEAHRDISHYLMHWYNWIRPHQFNNGLAPAQAEKKLNVVSGIS